MTVIAGLIITLAIPLIDVIWGRYLRANPPAFGSGRFSFRTKRTKKDEEVWAFANNLFAHMIMVTGVNTGIAATIFYFGALVITGDDNWAAASLSLFAVQAVCILIVYRITDFMVRKIYRPADAGANTGPEEKAELKRPESQADHTEEQRK